MARKTTNAEKPTPRKTNSTRAKSANIKPKKSGFRVDTLFTVVILAALITFVIYLNREKKTTEAEATPASEIAFVFSEEDGTPTSFEVKPAEGETVKVARDEKNAWALELPIKTEADQGASEAAASQISSLLVVSPVDADPSIFGLDAPAFIITIGFDNGKSHVLEIGDSTPTNSGYYVRLDKQKMLIVDLYGIDSLLQLASAPPYLNTPTPSPLPPTETPAPSTGAESTPIVTVTPTP
ncbi:MAG: DUF4340 domain-containing protein [Chloroflexi bacterium]|nr:DUF4340 domain-containing protein [Chloroflexota bacterium]